MAIRQPDYIVKASTSIEQTVLLASATAFALRDAYGNPGFGQGPDPAYHLRTQEIDTSRATLLVAVFLAFVNDVSGFPFDSKGNTWVQLGSESAGGPSVLIFYSIDPVVGRHHTFSRALNTVFLDTLLMVFAFGGHRFLFDKQQSSHVLGGSSVHPGLIVPSEQRELFVTAAATGVGGVTLGVDSGLTIQESHGFISTPTESHYGGAFAWKQQSGPLAAEDPAWSIAPAADVPAIVGCFKTDRGNPGFPDYIVKGIGAGADPGSSGFPDYIIKSQS